MKPLLQEDIVAIIREATEAVFSTMLCVPAAPQQVRQESGDPVPVSGIIAMVGIAGTWTGMGQIYCSPEMACRLAGALLMSEYTAFNEDVLDAVAEVANMIIGNAKTTLEERLGTLALGVPTVLYGRNYQARTPGVPDWTVVPFTSGEHTMDVRFCLMPSSTAPRMHSPRPEPALA